MKIVKIIVIGFLFASPLLFAEEHQHSDGSMKLHDNMKEAHKKMQDMKMSGNADKDFVQMMIAHHKSGIEMAKIEAKEGKNAGLKAIAENIIDAQGKEIIALEKYM